MGETNSKVAFEICVVTEDYLGSNLGPGINMVMFDNKNVQSPIIALDYIFQNEVDYHQAKFTIDLQPWSRLKIGNTGPWMWRFRHGARSLVSFVLSCVFPRTPAHLARLSKKGDNTRGSASTSLVLAYSVADFSLANKMRCSVNKKQPHKKHLRDHFFLPDCF
uniref:Arachidonate 5-lipoxygenase n=1 Tax=Mesocestoides corti TaxID=53468 RepID=A0A5K3FM90_MESCO